MAKADYILCDRCDCKIVYDAEDTILDGLKALGLDDAPILCKDCRATPADLPASPAPAVTPMQQVLHLARTVEEQVNAEGGEATVARIVALTIAAINAAAPSAPPAQAVQGEALTVLQWLLEQWEGDGWVTNQEAMAARVRDVLSGKASATPPAGEVREALIKAAETLLQAPDLHDVPDEDKDPETVDAERQLRAALAAARREG
ncbi:hypothetical protein ABNQ39_20935 [Azospirillum sp. A26]|uniref:hypothetical protein n=1 Tax=Azospirillum sp. A26 TaxID=3160607 RepID=UPI00366C5C8B